MNTLLILDRLIIPLFIVAFIAMISIIINLVRCLRKNSFDEMPILAMTFSIGFFIIPIMSSFIISLIMTGLSHQEFSSFIGNIDKEYSIQINNKTVQNPKKFLNELTKMSFIPAHHSYPIKKFKFKIKDKDGELELSIGQDSQIKNEYWIFYPKYRHTGANELGRIRTNIFENVNY